MPKILEKHYSSLERLLGLVMTLVGLFVGLPALFNFTVIAYQGSSLLSQQFSDAVLGGTIAVFISPVWIPLYSFYAMFFLSDPVPLIEMLTLSIAWIIFIKGLDLASYRVSKPILPSP